MQNANNAHETATLGGGCFWCLEPVYEDIEGVRDVTVGYAGGSLENPTYEQVSTGRTGHAEVVQVTFDPQVISYREILEIFFAIHDPTTSNRQGSDVGPQYRSIILTHSDQQKQVAQQVIQELTDAGEFSAPIVTEIAPLDHFYRAEEYHQEYYQKNPFAGYCQVIIRPKVSKFRKTYSDRLKKAT